MIVYNGAGTVPSPTGTQFFAIASTTFTTPITVNTVNPHGFFTGDTIEIEGADDPNTINALAGVNQGGLWQITVTGASSFQLNNSVGSLAGGAHGYVYDFEVQPAFQIASPGEAASMTTLGPVLQGLINAIPWMYRRTGLRRLHEVYSGNPASSPTTGSFSTWSTTALATAGVAVLLDGSGGGVTTLTPLSAMVTDINMTGLNPVVEVGDDLEVTWCGSVVPASGIDIQVFLYITDGAGHTNILKDSGAYIVGTGSHATPFTIHSTVSNPAPGAAHLSIGLAAAPQANTASATMIGPSKITVHQRRHN